VTSALPWLGSDVQDGAQFRVPWPPQKGSDYAGGEDYHGLAKPAADDRGSMSLPSADSNTRGSFVSVPGEAEGHFAAWMPSFRRMLPVVSAKSDVPSS
jgi:hypothetical protein